MKFVDYSQRLLKSIFKYYCQIPDSILSDDFGIKQLRDR